MENIKVVRMSHIERIRKITSKWLVGQDVDGVDAMHEIAAVLVEPEPLEPLKPMQLARYSPVLSLNDHHDFERHWHQTLQRQEQAEAWEAVFNTIHECVPGAFGDGKAVDQACSVIRSLVRAERAADQQVQRLQARLEEQVALYNQFIDATHAERERSTIQLAASRQGRVYLAGPMTGYADFNFPAFNAEATRLRAIGLDVVNPAEHGIVEGAEWGDYLRYDIAKLANCEAIHFLPGWQASKGAQLEHSVAKALGMPMTFAEGAQQELDNQQTAAVRDVLAERRRQVEKEGWTQEHDDEHDAGELAAAASAYALYASDELNPHSQGDGDYGRKEPDMWPFEASGWKPSNPRRALTKAGALILAEIERWDRMVAGITTHTDEQDGVKCIVTAKHNDNGTTEVLDVSFDEARMDVIGQNGPTGEHYAELVEVAIQNGGKPVDELPDGLSWEQAPEWADRLGLVGDAGEKFHVWFNDKRYQYVDQQSPFRFGDHSSFARERHEVAMIATRPAPAQRRDATQA